MRCIDVYVVLIWLLVLRRIMMDGIIVFILLRGEMGVDNVIAGLCLLSFDWSLFIVVVVWLMV